ncbi:MAG: hypothetical protein ACOWWO_06165 [Peptococcaceae bacterium]
MTYNFVPPICLSCGVSLGNKIELDQKGTSYEIAYCPSCGEIYKKKIVPAG